MAAIKINCVKRLCIKDEGILEVAESEVSERAGEGVIWYGGGQTATGRFVATFKKGSSG
jgi:hypothetical protein